LWNIPEFGLFSVHDHTRTEVIMTLLKPMSLAFAAASLIGIAGFAPTQAQTAYPGAPTGYSTESGYPAGQPGPGYPGVANGGMGLPYPGPQAATPSAQTTYPSAQPDYSGGDSAAAPPAMTGDQPPGAMPPQPETGYQPPERTQSLTNGPQANVENASPNWSARQNVIASHRYTRLVETSPAFRQARMRRECAPITDPQLHQSCIASFGNQDE
jgi:hypothetical protein